MKNKTAHEYLAVATVLFLPTQATADLREFAGIYNLDEHHLVSIDPTVDLAGNQALVYTDLDTYQVRRLYPADTDEYLAGEAFSRASPARFRFRFHRNSAGSVESLKWTDIELSIQQTGKREPLLREDVVFSSGDLELKGTLHRPACSVYELPLIVWLHGSGPQQRYGLLGLPQILAYYGYPVFTYDKRGVGDSEGDFLPAGIEELAVDAVAALDAIRTRPEFDSSRLGLLGTSQGGYIAFHAARLSGNVDFIVDLYGTPIDVGDQIIYDVQRDMEAEGYSSDEIAAASAMQARVSDYMRSVIDWDEFKGAVDLARDKRWYKYIFFDYRGKPVPSIKESGVAKMVRFDPLPDIRAFSGPVLYMLGEFDRLIEVERSRTLMATTLLAGGNSRFTIVVFPKAHHGLTLGIDGRLEERYSGLETSTVLTSLVPGYPDALLRWLNGRVGTSAAPPHCN